MQKAIVIKPHRSKFPNPIKLSNGEQVKVGKRDAEWKGWVWCTSESGIEGWVSEKYLEISDTKAVVVKDYDATELHVDVDDTLTISFEEAGWCWCEKGNGDKGWVPCECVKIVE